MDLFPESSTADIARNVSAMKALRDFLNQKGVRASFLALDARSNSEFLPTHIEHARAYSKLLSKSVLHKTEADLNRWNRVKSSYGLRRELPQFFHEYIERPLPGEFPQEGSTLEEYLESFEHSDPRCQEIIAKFNHVTRAEFECTHNDITAVLQRTVKHAFHRDSGSKFLHSTDGKPLKKKEVIALSQLLFDRPQLVSIDEKVVPLPPRSDHQGLFMSFINSDECEDTVRTDGLGRWNYDGDIEGKRVCRKTRCKTWTLARNGIGYFYETGEENSTHILKCIENHHPIVDRLKKTGNPYVKTDPSARRFVDHLFQSKGSTSVAQAFRAVMDETDKQINVRSVKLSRATVKPAQGRKGTNDVKSDLWDLLKHFPQLGSDFECETVITRTRAGEQIPSFVVMDKRLAAIAATSQLTKDELLKRKDNIDYVLQNSKISKIVGGGTDASGVFYEKSGLWHIDATFNMTDFYVTVIAFETHAFVHPSSDKRTLLPLLYCLHRKRTGETIADCFRAVDKMLRRLPSFRGKYASVLMSDNDACIKNLLVHVDFFSLAHHSHCDFHMLKNVKRAKAKKRVVDIDEFESDEENEEDDRFSVKNVPMDTTFCASLFGKTLGANPDKLAVKKFKGGALFHKSYESMVEYMTMRKEAFDIAEWNYFEKNSKNLYEYHGGKGRLLAGRLIMFFTNNTLENLHRTLKDAAPAKIDGRMFIEKCRQWFSDWYKSAEGAVKGQDARMKLKVRPAIAYRDMDDAQVSAHLKRYGIRVDDGETNFTNPIPEEFLDVVAPKRRKEFIAQLQEKYNVSVGSVVDTIVVQNVCNFRYTVTLKIQENILICGGIACANMICEHLLIGLGNLPSVFDREKVIAASFRHYFDTAAQFARSVRRMDGHKPGTREYTKASASNHIRPILDLESLPGHDHLGNVSTIWEYNDPSESVYHRQRTTDRTGSSSYHELRAQRDSRKRFVPIEEQSWSMNSTSGTQEYVFDTSEMNMPERTRASSTRYSRPPERLSPGFEKKVKKEV